jgi:hypothetical protein
MFILTQKQSLFFYIMSNENLYIFKHNGLKENINRLMKEEAVKHDSNEK